MEQEQPVPDSIITQQSDCVVVNMQIQLVVPGNAAASHWSNYSVVNVKASSTGIGGEDRHVAVDVGRLLAAVNVDPPRRLKDHAGDNDGASQNCCVVCTEPMKWVAVGRCGHRVVCSKCMVRNRFFKQNKRCCICQTHCPKVLVVKADADGNDVGDDAAAAAALSKLPWFSFRDGRNGNNWYHGYTKAYFEEEKEYQAARAACHGIISPFYEPKPLFIGVFAFTTFIRALIGWADARETRRISSQVTAFALSVFIALLLVAMFWSFVRNYVQYAPSELEKKRERLAEKHCSS